MPILKIDSYRTASRAQALDHAIHHVLPAGKNHGTRAGLDSLEKRLAFGTPLAPHRVRISASLPYRVA